MSLLIAAIENEVINNVWLFSEESWADLGDMVRAVFPGVEFVRMDDLPSGVKIYWYRVDGVWYDPYGPGPGGEPEPGPEE